MTVDAPAKLNLSLQILGKREDGFHNLETLIVPLPGLADSLSFTPAKSFTLSVEGGSLGDLEDNLVTRAQRLFAKRTGKAAAYQVRLEKVIPAGAGLGGGSSDAAATLRALDELEGTGLGLEVLEELAAELGSDVPFFLRDGACWCRGRGEIIEAAEAPALEVLLLKPSFGVATPDAYRRWAGSHPLRGVRYEPQAVNGVELRNDLERPVFEKFLFLAEMKSWLLEQFEVRGALMSGSGSTVFAVTHDHDSAGRIAERARRALDPKLWCWAGKAGGEG